jgi:hypothetical protein
LALSDNLIAYWSLDEASGNAIDAHGSNDLSDNNTVGTATGKIGNGRDFERDNTEYFSLADNTDLSTGDVDFALAFWVKFESLSGVGYLQSKGEEYYIYTTGTTLTFEALTTTGYKTRSIGTVTTGVWYFVVVWNDTTSNLMATSIDDGTPQTLAMDGTMRDHIGVFSLGAFGNGSAPSDMVLDEVGFWKGRFLTSSEITELYNSGNGRDYAYITGGSPPATNRRRRVICGAAA